MCLRKRSREEIFFYASLLFCFTPAIYGATISGFIRDLDGNGINNVQVDLTGTSTDLTVTDPTGAYSFTSASLGGSYVVTPSLSGYVFTPLSKSTANIGGDVTNFNFTYGKVWSGVGADALASNPLNWSAGVAPIANDYVRFDGTNGSKSCAWDVIARMAFFEMKVGFSTSVVAVSDMVLGSVTISSGEFRMRDREISIDKNFTHSGGKFRADSGGTALFNGNLLQVVSMQKSALGSGLFDSYFANFRVQSSSTVRMNSEMIVDETFNISSGRFELMNTTITLTGGTQSGSGGSFNYDDSGGTLISGSGGVDFESVAGGSYLIRQGASNSFFNFSAGAASDLTLASGINVAGQFSMGGAGSTVHLNAGNALNHTVSGLALIGPATNVGSATFSIGTSTFNFLSGVVIGTATFSVQGGQVNVKSSSLTVTGQGILTTPSGQTAKYVFWNGTHLGLNGGTLLIQGSSIFTSSATSVARFSTSLNGTVNIQSSALFDSFDVNGLRMGIGAVPVNLANLDFRNGPVGGAAINFDPVTQANITIDSPLFDVNCSTNVRAILDTSIISAADIDVVRSSGIHNGPDFEYDPSGLVNWGTLGTPSGFSGSAFGVSSITWSWTIVNHPYGFVVKSSTGGVLSSTLTYNATYWIETNLSTNTQYTRLVTALTDASQSDSATFSRFTDALPASSLAFTEVHISSLSLTWALNTNPSATIFVLERSTDDVAYTQLSSGTLLELTPYLDTSLIAEKRYYYRVKTQNGDGNIVSSSIKVSTVTLAIPPPSALSITPSTVANLGSHSFLISGQNIQSGAVVRLKQGSLVITSTDAVYVDAATITGSFNMTGALAGVWDVEIENPDGKISIGTGGGILTVTDASSAAPITIQNYLSATGVSFNTLGNETRISLAAGAMADGRVYVSIDPERAPMVLDPSKIAAANAALSGLTMIPGTAREVLAYTDQGIFTTGFGGTVSLAISFVDQNNDGVVDNAAVRSSTLKMMTLNETTSTWQLLTTATLDTSTRRMSSNVSHFSVYALFGSLAAETLADVKVYPSPWLVGSAGKFDSSHITISNLTESGTIRIYTLGTDLVKTIVYDTSNAGVATWDGKNESGADVKSGVYLIFIESAEGQKKTVKVGIER